MHRHMSENGLRLGGMCCTTYLELSTFMLEDVILGRHQKLPTRNHTPPLYTRIAMLTIATDGN